MASIEKTPKGQWEPEQALGAPDTHRAGDIPTAWASLKPDGGKEWLQVGFKKATQLAEVRIRETFNPGAVIKVTAFVDNNKEKVLWEGEDTTDQAPDDLVVHVEGDVTSNSIKIYLDTKRKQGWNEIDAVEIVGKDGSRQWATSATASSTYATRAASNTTNISPNRSSAYYSNAANAYRNVQVDPFDSPPGTVSAYPNAKNVYTSTKNLYVNPEPRATRPDVFAELHQKRVVVHLEGGIAISGTLVKSFPGFILLKSDSRETVVVNVKKMIFLKTVSLPRK